MPDPQKVILREQALESLQDWLAPIGPKSLLLVLDSGAIASQETSERIDRLFPGIRVARFSDFSPNPTLEVVASGVKLGNRGSPDAVVAIGGGTAIDLAKLIACFVRSDEPLRQHLQQGTTPAVPRPPLAVAPTTAGTGSESTQFAVVYVDGVKHSVDSPSLLPDLALVDPTLTYSMPPAVTAATGLDAFCQAVESIWSVAASDASIKPAAAAIRLALASLTKAYRAPDPESRQAMCRAANLAGQAINTTRTTASHAFSYGLTSEFGVPHGAAVATTLSSMLRYNAGVSENDCQDPRGPAAVRQRIALLLELLGDGTLGAACQTIEEFVASVGCPTSFHQAGVRDPVQLSALLSKVNPKRLGNNPRKICASGTSVSSGLEFLPEIDRQTLCPASSIP